MSLNKLVLIALLLLSGLISRDGNASGIASAMQQNFNSMVSVNEPSLSSSARRGVISGGSVYIRNKIVQPSWFSFDYPNFSSGCGGWDLFGGSFSFISAQEIVQMLRSIASNAIAYAFQLALKTISKDIADTMDALMEKMNVANFFQMNSCEIGMKLVDSIRDRGSRTEANNLGANVNTSTGASDDNSSSQNHGESRSPALDAADQSPEVKKLIVKGNLIWRALKEQSATSWMGGGEELMEQIMSLTGTYIVCAPGEDGCEGTSDTNTASQQDLTSRYRKYTLSLRQLVKGNSGGETISVWRCSDDECLNPRESNDNSMKGMETLLLDQLLGTTRLPGDGLIGRWRANAGQPSANDLKTITGLGEYSQMALNLAVKSENAARNFILAFSEVMAAEITQRTVDSLLQNTVVAAGELEHGANEEVQKLASQARKRMNEDLQEFRDSASANSEKFLYYRNLMLTTESPNVSAIGVR